MNPEIKAKWIAALRSGKYRQGKGVLRRADEFCCLGVLCDVVRKDVGGRWLKPSNIGVRNFKIGSETDCHILPDGVIAFVGLPPCDGNPFGVAVKNDKGASFAEIADHIEANL